MFDIDKKITDKKMKSMILENLELIQNMSVKEYTLYKKWTQLNLPTFVKFSKDNKVRISEIKNNIWCPNNINDYENLNIDVIPVETIDQQIVWRTLRNFCHSSVWNASPGRMGKFIVVHKETKKDPFFGIEKINYKYLGIISLASDFLAVGGRDEKIGWTSEDKFNGKLNYIAMASTISPTQPLGFNYVGGKLIALMSCSDVVEKWWNNQYNEQFLCGITTTSLYGGYSQYNNLKYWKKCKSTKGNVIIEPTENIYELMKVWLRQNYKERYDAIHENKSDSGVVKSHPKLRIMTLAYTILSGIPEIKTNASRGVYWCPLYENSESFLRNETQKIENKRFDNSVKSLSDLWKQKYAKKRVDNLIKNGIMDNTKTLFYDDMIGHKWENVKEKYLEKDE